MVTGDSGEKRAQIRERRKEAFERELARLMDRLYGTALQLTRNPDDAEDVVLEAVGKAWRELDQLRDLDCLEGWLFRTLNRTFISHWRRRRSRQDREAELEPALEGEEGFSLFERLHQPFLLWWGTPEAEFVRGLLHEDIERALSALPDEFRILVVMVDVEGYTYDECSRWLGVPVGTVRSRLNRARNRLQRTLWQQACDAGLAIGGRGPAESGGGT